MNNNRFHITDTETYNETGLKVIDFPEQIAAIAKTHLVVIDFEDRPAYRPDLYVNRIKARIRKACNDIDLQVTIQTPGRTPRITVRALHENEMGSRQATTAKANRTRSLNPRFR